MKKQAMKFCFENYASINNILHPRTWIIVANRNHVRIFQDSYGRIFFIDELSPAIAARTRVMCRIISGNHILLHYDPIPFARHCHSEPVSFSDKILATLDEALWNDEFDKIILLSAPGTMNTLTESLSLPVRACVIACINSDLSGFDCTAQQDELRKIIPDTSSFWKGHENEKKS